ncbi:MAG: carboxypeptidase-like regulatory domain-containing protein, partial [Acidobacteria bacterium]|nr:carboxypeptidase-like regulatory domain-containing protein [Acidobacteriota bacterium]
MFSRAIFQSLLLTAISVLALTAQTGSGTVQGVVKDASSAVVAGATINITHTDTMRKYSTTTNQVGFFGFPPVLPGPYEIVVEAPGMQSWAGKFLLVVGQKAEISPVLQVGALTTQITVPGEVAPLLATTEATISRNLERARIEQLPVDGRNIASLVLMSTPSLVSGQDGAINPINTGLRDAVELYQDGAIIKNRDTGDWAGRLPGVDSVEELRVETSLSSAQFDRPGSVILSTRSGTNGIHGSLFETNRNSGVGVARRRQDYYTKPPHYVRNEFGGSVGGPVLFPKLYNGRNRTFFFTSYELYRLASASTTSTTMPTLDMRSGDYSGLVDSLGRLTTLYDPLTTGGKAANWARTPFPNNRIPTTRESPVAKYLYSVMPEPTNTANPNVSSNYFGLARTTTSDYMSTSRIDHRLDNSDQVFGRFSLNRDSN